MSNTLPERAVGVIISESFEVRASPDRVWDYLLDPARVVECLPGAELVEVQDDRTFVGKMGVKVGPVTASFRGRARFEDVDHAARRVRMTGEGQDTGGSGMARMTMTSEVTSLPGGGSRVVVESDVEVAGRLAQFGRGLMEEVSRQMFAQFAACAQTKLEAGEVLEADAPPSGAEAVAAAAPPAPPASQPLRIMPVLFAALRAWLRKLMGRSS